MVRGTYGLDDFKLFVTDYMKSVDDTIEENRASLPENERQGAAMKNFEKIYRGKLPRTLELVREGCHFFVSVVAIFCHFFYGPTRVFLSSCL